MDYELAEMQRLLSNLMMVGLIHDVDHPNKQLKVIVGELITGWLPLTACIGRNFNGWTPLRVGTQVLICCPDGNPSNAIITQMLYTTDLDAPATDPALDLLQFDDGTKLSYNSESHTLTIDSQGPVYINTTGDISIKSAGTMTLDASKIVIKGPVEQTGGDMTSDGVSAQGHIHDKVKAGLDKSAEPVK
jgi:phage baseplate assembly protein V